MTVVLDDPVLDARHPFTGMFLLAEHWRNKYLQLKRKGTFMRKHELKTWPVYFEEIASGRLSFSIRDNDGRGFQKGDIAILREWDPNASSTGSGQYTGRWMELDITYVESSWGLQPGKVALAFGTNIVREVRTS